MRLLLAAMLLCHQVLLLIRIGKVRRFAKDAKISKIFYLFQLIFLLLRALSFFAVVLAKNYCSSSKEENWSTLDYSIQILEDCPDFLYLMSMFFLQWIEISTVHHGYIYTTANPDPLLDKKKCTKCIRSNLLWLIAIFLVIYGGVLYGACSTISNSLVRLKYIYIGIVAICVVSSITVLIILLVHATKYAGIPPKSEKSKKTVRKMRNILIIWSVLKLVLR
jgi:hypothetical protein